MVLGIVVGFVGVVLVLLVIGYAVSVYNQLVRLRKRCDQAKQNIDVVLAQRQSELTKLIDAVEEYMEYEKEVLTALTEAREQAERAATPSEEAAADEQIRVAMSAFRARVEAYPELRSQTSMLQFQERISDLESQISDRREFYNEAVTQYNTRIDQIPYVFVARQLGYESLELFTATPDQIADVDVSAAFDRDN